MRRALLILAASGTLTACGGGDDGSGSGTTSGGSGTFSSYFVESWDAYEASAASLLTTSRYSVQEADGSRYMDLDDNGSYTPGTDVLLYGNPILHTGIHYAHAAGLSGAGQVVAVSDEGFRTSHEAISDDILIEQSGLPQTDHGTFVASIITADTSDMIGVAPDAQLIVGHWDQVDLIDTGEQALANNAVAWNNSWGYVVDLAGTPADLGDFNTFLGSGTGADYLDALRDYAAYGNVVFAISNDYDITTIGLMAGLPALVSELEDGWIAVVNAIATSTDGDVTSASRVSGACLEAAAWCITADGSWTGATSTSDDSYDFGTGTSFAAPTVSGALALLAEAFPSLDPHELRLRLFATADNTFTEFTTDQVVELAPGYDSAVSDEFGHGFLDVAAALLPIGTITVTTGETSTISASQPLVMAGTASGGAIAASLDDVNLLGKDVFAGEFSFAASSLVTEANPVSLFASQTAMLDGETAPVRPISTALFGRDPTVENLLGGFYLATYLPQYSEHNETAGMSFGQRHQTDFGHYDWQFGLGSDNGALLPLWQNEDGHDLASMGFAVEADVSNRARFQASAVVASASASGSTSALFLNSTEVSYIHDRLFDRHDRLKVSLRQPFAVTAGHTDLTVTVDDGAGGTLQTLAVDLAPERRETQLALEYELALSGDGALTLAAVHAFNRGHVAGEEESGLFFGYRREF